MTFGFCSEILIFILSMEKITYNKGKMSSDNEPQFQGVGHPQFCSASFENKYAK